MLYGMLRGIMSGQVVNLSAMIAQILAGIRARLDGKAAGGPDRKICGPLNL